ncbi:MAG: UDP-N-acetylmuramoyl-tripeptide--D-alanyl-D-alanine ligase [Holosporales bacterium]|jgi:UDP-N-acetylmuramoyl-tripeptide--D-alanyl-D-alanine ligase|nr:UDP-N-acetylmuramoyl-tripeptide--D-alanyl-D-alanine ligase [Holosporales bacterium]
MKITNSLLEQALKIESCPSFTATGISIDSRTINKGELFIAIGKKGNSFVKQAIENGARLAIVDDPLCVIAEKTVLVPNALEALKSIGLHIKRISNPKEIVGITGSVGKTTTKAWIHSILENKFNVVSSMKNYNTIYGLPISLALLEEDTDYGIFEMGSNNVGEIAELSKYLKPDIAVITNIYDAHIGRFGNLENLANEKISIIEGMKSGCTLIYDGDSEFMSTIVSRAKANGIKLISVGFKKHCEFRITSYRDYVKAQTPIGTIEYQLDSTYRHYVYVSLCVFATIHAIGLNILDFLGYCKNLKPMVGRGKVSEHLFNGKYFKIIDESYNASPAAVLSTLEYFNNIQAKSKIIVLGQIKELGDMELRYHKLVANAIHKISVNNVFFIGDKSLWNTMCVECFENLDNFSIEKILKTAQNGSVILLKGSRDIGLDKIISYIKCSTI